MGKTCTEVKQNYRKILAEGVHLNRDIYCSPNMDYDFVGQEYSFGNHVNGTLKKKYFPLMKKQIHNI